MRARAAALVLVIVFAIPAWAAEHPSLAKARELYNAGDYDGAIAAAEVARADKTAADAAALVAGRSFLERYRLRADPADLAAARDALRAVRGAALSPRDHLDLLVGLGQALYESEAFGAAAQLFQTALDAASELEDRDRLLLLDWWATAMDREARERAVDRRTALYEQVMQKMQDELRQDPGSAPANYWLVVAVRGAGDIEGAWDAAIAGWVRAALKPNTRAALREDLDGFVTQVLIPERVRDRPASEQQRAAESLREEWNAVKDGWGRL